MTIEALPGSSGWIWAGRALSVLAIAFLLLDAAMKLVPAAPVMEAMKDLGFNGGVALARGLGMLLLFCTLLYAHPRTAAIGAVLLTGYLGGAIAAHLRLGNPLFSHVLFGLYVGLFVWGGLLIRNPQLRALLLPGAQP
ncbi:DoxX family protein [Solimonas fluminis]|uniref:DoxX family protein n=1 Tax=Solimonas fluminis TaxID=2086571 RepID=UPI001A9C91C9|nr:DoxX family protein [Solimonas fluminis]